MKRLTTAILLLSLLTTVESQNLKSLFAKYSKDERFEYVSIGPGMISMANIFGSENEEFTEVFSKINGMKILSYTDGFDNRMQENIEKEIKQIVNEKEFETLMEMREKEELLNIYMQAKKPEEAHMLIMTQDSETISIVWLKGALKPEDLIKLLAN